MKQNTVSALFRQEVWAHSLPQHFVIPSITIKLNKQDIDYLTDDNTNPDLTQFSPYQHFKEAIEQLKGKVFAKIASRSAKDCTHLDRTIKSVKDLIMLAKISQFITEGLCDDEEESQIILRQYNTLFQKELDQFRVYSIGEKVVGICQKNPSFLSTAITTNQLEKIQELHSIIASLLTKETEQKLKNKVQFVFDLYCSPNGKTAFIFAIEPFHIHCLSLFTEQQLRKHYESNKQKPKIRTVLEEHQLKQADLSQYKAGKQLQHLTNVKEWVQFMEKSE